MLVGAVGYNYRHRKDFIMDCPHGVGCPLILLIKEPSVFVINGIEHRAEKNSFILLSPDTPVKYHAAEEFIPMIGCILIMSRAIMKNLKGLMFQKIRWYTLEISMSLVR